MRLSGSITALATPFTSAGDIDFPAWRRLLQAQLDAGTQGVIVAGSTGEAAALFDEEYDTLLASAVEFLGGETELADASCFGQDRREASGKTTVGHTRAQVVRVDCR